MFSTNTLIVIAFYLSFCLFTCCLVLCTRLESDLEAAPKAVQHPELALKVIGGNGNGNNGNDDPNNTNQAVKDIIIGPSSSNINNV